MADYSEDRNDQSENGPVGSPHSQSDGGALPAETEDIDSLLSSAADSLAEVDGQLGPETEPSDSAGTGESEANDSAVQSDAAQPSDTGDRIRNLDGTLGQLACEMDSLKAQVDHGLDEQATDSSADEAKRTDADAQAAPAEEQADNPDAMDITSEITITEDEKVVEAELAGALAETSNGESSEKDRKKSEQYAHFTKPQRAIVQTLDTVNKPFSFVPDGARDIVGIVGLVTCIVSMIAAALILLFK